VLGKGLKYERVSVNPSEAQFVESQHFTIEEICRIFGVQPRKVGHAMSGSSVTYANIEQSQIDHQIDAVFPWASRIETALSSVLPKPQFSKFNLDAQIRVDLISRYKAHGMSLRDGWENADAVRAIEDKEPMPNGQGKTFLWPLVVKPSTEPDAIPKPAPEEDPTSVKYGPTGGSS
jgi:HK97 family phage portal protein